MSGLGQKATSASERTIIPPFLARPNAGHRFDTGALERGIQIVMGETHGGRWRDNAYNHLQVCEGRDLRHTSSHVPAKARCDCATSWLVRKNESVLEGTLDQRCPFKYCNGIRIQRGGRRTEIQLSGSWSLFRHKGA